MEDTDIEAILDEYPEAKPFADLVNAGTVEDFREVVADIARRVRQSGSETPTASVQEAPVKDEPTPAELVANDLREQAFMALLKERNARAGRRSFHSGQVPTRGTHR